MILRKRDEIIECHAVEAFCEVGSVFELNVRYLAVIRIENQSELHQIRVGMKLVCLILCGGICKINPAEIREVCFAVIFPIIVVLDSALRSFERVFCGKYLRRHCIIRFLQQMLVHRVFFHHTDEISEGIRLGEQRIVHIRKHDFLRIQSL